MILIKYEILKKFKSSNLLDIHYGTLTVTIMPLTSYMYWNFCSRHFIRLTPYYVLYGNNRNTMAVSLL